MSTGARLFTFGAILSLLTAAGCASPSGSGPRSHNDGGTGSGNQPGGGGTGNTSSNNGGDTTTGPIIDPTMVSNTCGNGTVESGEQCDDTNKEGGDGCSKACKIEPDFDCPTPGMACVKTSVCGDGRLASSEGCDDGNTMGGDGCTADCSAVEPGYQCRAPGKHCVPLCGDHVLTGTENCEDGNNVSGDGCSSSCLVEPGWACDDMGVCTKSECGNGKVEPGESCDKGMDNGLFYGDGTGCSKTCTQEPSCRDAMGKTVACQTPCGDGNIDPGEDCDDGNQLNGDGCSKECKNEAGFTCMPEEKKDTTTCSTGAGDCLILPIVYRDFDDQRSGHPDFFYYGASVGGTKTYCVPNASGANLLDQPENGSCPPTDATDPCQGLVSATLGTDGKPTLNTARAGGSSCACTFTDWDSTGILTGATGVKTCSSGSANPSYVQNVMVKVIQSADSFKQWYHDDPISTKVVDRLELAAIGNGQYQFSSSSGRTVYDDLHEIFMGTGVTTLESGFFPLETTTRQKVCNLWPYWNQTATCTHDQWDPRGSYTAGMEGTGGPVPMVQGVLRNFYFTSEVRYLFRFAGGESLSFFGDDDVWVFINGHLVLDLGAPHERMKGTVTLDATGASAAWAISVQNVSTGLDQAIPGAAGSGMVTGLGLEKGKTYEIAIFHADQHPRESNYQLTLSGYSTSHSNCTPTCGDGVPTGAEECDDGAMNMNDVYGGCTTECKFGPFCGDGVQNGDEECDNGRDNGKQYGEMGCTAACKNAHRCGDGFIDTAFEEECDDGANNGVGDCLPSCKLRIK